MTLFSPVAVGLPVYNGEKYISESIESILGQDFGDFDFLISDNCSTDSTWDICNHYGAIDDRIRLNRNKTNIGAIANFQLVFDQTKSNYFMWHAHDDILMNNYFSTALKFMEDRKDYVCFTSKKILKTFTGEEKGVYSEEKERNSDSIVERFQSHFAMGAPCKSIYGLLRRDLVTKAGRFPIMDMLPDKIFMFQLLIVGKIYEHPQPLQVKRIKEYSAAKVKDNLFSIGPKTMMGSERAMASFPHLKFRLELSSLIKSHPEIQDTERNELLEVTQSGYSLLKALQRDAIFYGDIFFPSFMYNLRALRKIL